MNWYEDSVYIKMCEKATEIQNLAPRETNIDSKTYFEQHNFIVGADGQVSPEDDGCYFGLTEERQVWLPRQDQLHILSGLSWYLFDKTCVTWATTNSDYQRESKEIVGLRVVMQELYYKTWDSEKEDWVKIKKAGVG